MEIKIRYEKSNGEKLEIDAKGFFPLSSISFSTRLRDFKKTVIKNKEGKVTQYFEPEYLEPLMRK